MASDFSRLVSLACHDFRTPLATMQGRFSKTLLRRGGSRRDPAGRWLANDRDGRRELIELIELLSVAARIDGGRYDPVVREVDSLELRGRPGRVGRGAAVLVDAPRSSARSPRWQTRPARHGGVDVAVSVDGARPSSRSPPAWRRSSWAESSRISVPPSPSASWGRQGSSVLEHSRRQRPRSSAARRVGTCPGGLSPWPPGQVRSPEQAGDSQAPR